MPVDDLDKRVKALERAQASNEQRLINSIDDIKRLETKTDTLSKLTETVAVSNERISTMDSTISKLDNTVNELNVKIDEINEKPAQRWEQVITALISTVVGAFFGWMFGIS